MSVRETVLCSECNRAVYHQDSRATGVCGFCVHNTDCVNERLYGRELRERVFSLLIKDIPRPTSVIASQCKGVHYRTVLRYLRLLESEGLVIAQQVFEGGNRLFWRIK